MMADQKLLDKINIFLEDKTFTILDPLNFGLDHFSMDVKVKLTGTKDYISVGDKKPFIEYELYIVGPQKMARIIELFFSNKGGEEEIDTKSYTLPTIRHRTEELLQNFLKYFGVNEGVICKKMINAIPKKISESLLKEEKYDSLVRQVVRDVVNLFKNKEHGNFYLPDDEMFYSFGNLNDFNVELELTPTEQIDGYNIESNFYREDDIMEIQIEYNPKYGPSIIYDLIGDLNDNIRHELQHSIQQSQDYKFPKKEPKSPLKYYTQPHEIEAQKKGFKRVAKLQRKPLEQIVRQWFNKNRNRHGLSDKEIEIVIDQILK